MKKKRIKILHVIGIMNYGGAETMIMNLFREIDREIFQFDFLVHRRQKGDYDQEIRELGGEIFTLPEYKIFNLREYRKECRKFFQIHKDYDIVHGHIESCAPVYLAEANRVGIFTIAHCHSTGFQQFFPKHLYNCLTFATRFTADFFLACSKDAGRNRFGNKIISSERFFVFYNGINAENYIYSETRHKNLKKIWGLENTLVIGHVGRLAKEKNQAFLIKVFKAVLQKEKKAVLVLVGDGKEKHTLEKMVSEYRLEEKIIFTGNRSDIPDMMNLFDVFVFPSLYEGLGIALIEAQASGLPCIVADTIVDEAIITDQVEVISLADPLCKWGKKVIEAAKSNTRKNTYEIICNAGFDIKYSVSKLEQMYKGFVK